MPNGVPSGGPWPSWWLPWPSWRSLSSLSQKGSCCSGSRMRTASTPEMFPPSFSSWLPPGSQYAGASDQQVSQISRPRPSHWRSSRDPGSIIAPFVTLELYGKFKQPSRETMRRNRWFEAPVIADRAIKIATTSRSPKACVAATNSPSFDRRFAANLWSASRRDLPRLFSGPRNRSSGSPSSLERADRAGLWWSWITQSTLAPHTQTRSGDERCR